MLTRNDVLRVLFLFFVMCGFPWAGAAAAQNTTLYGITYDGKLVTIDVSTVTVTQVRTTLPTISGIYTGLTLYNNSFQTFTRDSNATCQVVSFGPTTADELTRGLKSPWVWGWRVTTVTHRARRAW